jgi:signal transduction histidine kinase
MPEMHTAVFGVSSSALSDDFPKPGGRSRGQSLEQEIGVVANHVLLASLLEAVQGLVAVLNSHRQIIALNDHMLQSLGGGDLHAVLGLRLGEVFHCPHALKAPEGCGTTPFCQTCGAAIAQVVALTTNRPCERLCSIELSKEQSQASNLFVRVRVAPLEIAGYGYLLLFLEDVSQEQRAALLEQTFLHDLSNTATGLSAGVSLLAQSGDPDPALTDELLQLAGRLTREIELQRCLVHSTLHQYTRKLVTLDLQQLFRELSASLRHHPAAKDKTVDFSPHTEHWLVKTDSTLIQRILTNMLVNALEATAAGGNVRLQVREEDDTLKFSVWNEGRIPQPIALRIFQRNFSTKGQLGRGLGTYAMKLLGETLLGGHVSFTTTAEEGTFFLLELPSHPRTGT